MNNQDRALPLSRLTAETGAPLSEHFAVEAYRVRGSERPKWAKATVRTKHCDECAMIQHETRGAVGPRMQPRHRRTLPDRKVSLLLCTRHAQAWRERDEADLSPHHKFTRPS